jgi:hypothetical protein
VPPFPIRFTIAQVSSLGLSLDRPRPRENRGFECSGLFSPSIAPKWPSLLEKAMFTALQHAYAKLGDDELLQLASDRSSLSDEAKLALDTEVHRQSLTAVDITSHEDFVRGPPSR